MQRAFLILALALACSVSRPARAPAVGAPQISSPSASATIHAEPGENRNTMSNVEKVFVRRRILGEYGAPTFYLWARATICILPTLRIDGRVVKCGKGEEWNLTAGAEIHFRYCSPNIISDVPQSIAIRTCGSERWQSVPDHENFD